MTQKRRNGCRMTNDEGRRTFLKPGRDGQKPMGPPLTRACFTVLRLLHERGLGKASPFSAYLSVLPLDHRLPMEWNESEVELLKVRSSYAMLLQTLGHAGRHASRNFTTHRNAVPLFLLLIGVPKSMEIILYLPSASIARSASYEKGKQDCWLLRFSK